MKKAPILLFSLGLFSLSAPAFGEWYHFSAETTVYPANGEECHLGDVVIQGPSRIRCESYEPATGPRTCADWPSVSPHDQHVGVVNTLVPSKEENWLTEFKTNTRIPSRIRVGLTAGGRGAIATRTTDRAALNTPTQGQTVKKAVTVVYEFPIAYLNINKSQQECLALQSPYSVRTGITLNDGEKVLGFISQVNLGMAKHFSVEKAKLTHDGAEISCSALGYGATLGSLTPVATEAFIQAVQKGNGSAAAAGSGNVAGVATTSFEVTPFVR